MAGRLGGGMGGGGLCSCTHRLEPLTTAARRPMAGGRSLHCDSMRCCSGLQTAPSPFPGQPCVWPQAAVNLLSTVLDTPEFFWSAPDSMQNLYKRVCEYMELDNRVEVLNNRLAVSDQGVREAVQTRFRTGTSPRSPHMVGGKGLSNGLAVGGFQCAVVCKQALLAACKRLLRDPMRCTVRSVRWRLQNVRLRRGNIPSPSS